MNRATKTTLYLSSAFFLVVVLLFRFGTSFYMDYLWYESQGQFHMWRRMIVTRGIFAIEGFGLALCFYMLNFYFVLSKAQYFLIMISKIYYYLIIFGIGGGLAFFFNAPLAYSLWDSWVLSFAPNYGFADPVYGLDASFYMFRLGWYQGVLNWIQVVIVFSAIIVLVTCVLPFYIPSARERVHRPYEMIFRNMTHLSILVSLFIVFLSMDLFLKRFNLIFDGSSAKTAGASYTDVHARSFAYVIFAGLGILTAMGIFISSFWKRWKFSASLLGIWVIAYIPVIHFYPAIVGMIQVSPNEFVAEKEYIEHSIRYTREGYGLTGLERKNFAGNSRLSASDLQKNRGTIDNIRLWDYRPFKATLRQLQEIRQYYEFMDVDVDRYQIEGKVRQVMVAARELNQDKLPARAKTWESKHLQYTHGYGLAMAPSNRVLSNGLPDLWIRDFPPVITQKGLNPVKRPEIYYGERTNDYVIVNTTLKEIDYPKDKNFAETSYAGKGGMLLGKGLRYLLIAAHFDTWKILVSRYVDSKSKILFRRNIHQIVRLLAPFLEYDRDPYMVVGNDGRLYWMMDAYTVSDRFPYSARLEDQYLQTVTEGEKKYLSRLRGINYIRNSVKVVIDAYNGKTSFYVSDPSDPIIRTWSAYFKHLFLPFDKMPDFLKEHVRYPENLFLIQAAMYTDYHMDDPRAFYNLEDRWQLAEEVYAGQTQNLEPYYTVIQLPGQEKEEYILMMPFIPDKKENMIAWMAVRCDYKDTKDPKENPYGKIIVFDFPHARQVYGPIQIESRIDQDPSISRDLTLWNQQGSQVIRGNLLVIPIANSLLYIEPIYLQSTNSPFPELRRVIAADSTGVVMGENLEDALSLLTSLRASDVASLELGSDASQKIQGKQGRPSLSDGLIRSRMLLRKVQEAAAKGRWKEFGTLMQELKETLERTKP